MEYQITHGQQAQLLQVQETTFGNSCPERRNRNYSYKGQSIQIVPSSVRARVPRPSADFVKRFERKYGRGAVASFINLIEQVWINLSDVARAFGFTREYARHVFKKIYGIPYGDMRRAKLRIRKEARIAKIEQQGRTRAYLMEIGQLIKATGLDYELRRKARFYFYLSNGKTIGIRRCKSPLRIGNVYYYRFNNFAWAPDEFDFLVLRCEGNTKVTHYVIPHQFMPRRIVSLNPESTRPGSKYAKFREAWHLLHGASALSQAVG